jgi:hypothetical protein
MRRVVRPSRLTNPVRLRQHAARSRTDRGQGVLGEPAQAVAQFTVGQCGMDNSSDWVLPPLFRHASGEPVVVVFDSVHRLEHRVV